MNSAVTAGPEALDRFPLPPVEAGLLLRPVPVEVNTALSVGLTPAAIALAAAASSAAASRPGAMRWVADADRDSSSGGGALDVRAGADALGASTGTGGADESTPGDFSNTILLSAEVPVKPSSAAIICSAIFLAEKGSSAGFRAGAFSGEAFTAADLAAAGVPVAGV